VFWLGFLRGVEEVALIERALQLETLETSSVATELYVAYLMHTYRLDEARRAQLRLLAAARRVGDAREGEFLMGLGWVEVRAGRWDEALSCADAAIELNRQTGRVYEETYSHYLRAWVNVYRGEVEDAERDAHIVIRTGERLESELCLSYGRAVLGNVAFARGDYELALEHLSASGIWDGAGDPALSPGLPQRAQMLIALGRSEEIRPSLDLYERSCRDRDRCVHLAAALRSQALMAAASGNFPLADEICAESLDQYDRIDVPFERAQTLLVRGRIARRARKKSAAQVALAEALGIFEALGAKLWAQAARDEIAQIGGRASSPGKLTPAEERIAELVASGRSNTEVAHQLSLSPKTVE
jgi:ATP/maltotriose-dependent transcriptional regulator MalT